MNAVILQPDTIDYVTFTIGDQLFGLPILQVQDVFQLNRLTVVPLAPPECAGVLNLRGRIVTAIDLRVRLGLPPNRQDKSPMAVGIDYGGEAFGLLIDKVGEVLKVSKSSFESNPVNLDPRWVKASSGVHRLDGKLMIVLNVDEVLAHPDAVAA
jgi:purine-binding chemotaxis protein CheW